MVIRASYVKHGAIGSRAALSAPRMYAEGAMIIDTGYDLVTIAAALWCVGGGNLGINRSTAHDPTASRIAAVRSNACRIR